MTFWMMASTAALDGAVTSNRGFNESAWREHRPQA
jgi:hypothetical protein